METARTRPMAASSKTRAWLLGLPLALCLLPVLYAAAQTTGKTVRHHSIPESQPAFPPQLTQAEDAIERKDFTRAEPLLQQVTAADPSNYQAWFDLGFVYHALEREPESIDAYRKSVAAKPDVFESNLNLGLALARGGQPDAERFLRAATTLTPTAHVEQGRARAWLSLAHILAAGQPAEAITAYQKAAELQPADPEPHLALGPLLEHENRFSDAIAEYRKALALDPKSSDALIGMAN